MRTYTEQQVESILRFILKDESTRKIYQSTLEAAKILGGYQLLNTAHNIDLICRASQKDDVFSLFMRVKGIIEDDKLSWHHTYHTIFSPEIAEKVSFEWYDMDYEDDVMAWFKGFEEHIKNLTAVENNL